MGDIEKVYREMSDIETGKSKPQKRRKNIELLKWLAPILIAIAALLVAIFKDNGGCK